jgi:hypothetical protein
VPRACEAGNLADDVRHGHSTPSTAARGCEAAVRLDLAADPLPAVRLAGREGDVLQLVLRNLLDNAIKYSPRGAVRRGASPPDERDRPSHVTVRDDGRGHGQSRRTLGARLRAVLARQRHTRSPAAPASACISCSNSCARTAATVAGRTASGRRPRQRSFTVAACRWSEVQP